MNDQLDLLGAAFVAAGEDPGGPRKDGRRKELVVGEEYVSAGGTGLRVRIEEDCGDHYRVSGARLPARVIFKAATDLWEPVR